MNIQNKLKLQFYKLASVLLLVSLSGCWGQKKARKIYGHNITKAPFDAIIITGVPYDGKSWQEVMMLRVYWAKYLYENGYTRHIIFSGSAVYTPYLESEVMRLYALRLGIPDEVIFTESQAEHSVENVYYSLLLGYDQGFENMALATDPYQLYFMRKVFKKRKVTLSYLPIDYEILKAIEKPEPVIEPLSARVDNFVPLTEREGFFERLRGTRGMAVDFSKLR